MRLVKRSTREASHVVAAFETGRTARVWRTLVRYGVALVRLLRKTISMPPVPAADDLLSYVPKRDKIVEGVLLLIEQARARNVVMTKRDLLIAMFLADKGHLDAYGRPVFFDNYVATADGPIGVSATEMLDPAFDWSTVGMDAAPWIHGAADDADWLSATRETNLRRLSRSDVATIESGLTMVTSLDDGQLRLFTQRQRAYEAAWRSGAGGRLDPRLIPDERDDEMINDLLYASRHAFVAPRRT